MVFFTLNASFSHMGLGAVCNAAALRCNGMEAVIVEGNTGDRTDGLLARLFAAVQRDADRLAGFSCYIWNIDRMKYFASCLKKLLPEATIVFGGPEVSYPESADAFFGAHPYADCLIIGEGEEACLELVRRIRSGEKIRRLVLGGGSGYLHGGTEFEIIYNGAEKYPTVYYESSRGCPYSCSYCISGIGSGKKKVSALSAGTAVSELTSIADKFYAAGGNCAMNVIKLCDRSFNFDIKRANTIWQGLIRHAESPAANPATGNDYGGAVRKSGAASGKTYCPYQFEIYPENFDEDSFAILAGAPKGLFRFEIGIQSLHPPTLDAIGRRGTHSGTGTARTLANIKRLHAAGNIPLHLDLIAGLPHETYETFAAGFDALYGSADFIQIGFLKLLHGTRIRDQSHLYGMIAEDTPPYTVLATASLPYPEMIRLRHMETVYSRYVSPAYDGARKYALNGKWAHSPFAMYEALAAHWEKMNYFSGNIGQRTAYQAFYDALNCHELPSLADILENDFNLHEHKRIIIYKN